VRSVLWHAKAAAHPSAFQQWAVRTEQRRGHNVAAGAAANKLARIVWAVWTEQRRSSRIRLNLHTRRRSSQEDCTELRH
jgi:hypothetical protein